MTEPVKIYEVYTKDFSVIVQASSFFEADLEFHKRHPLTEIVGIWNTAYVQTENWDDEENEFRIIATIGGDGKIEERRK
jgi:hypothetical protein